MRIGVVVLMLSSLAWADKPDPQAAEKATDDWLTTLSGNGQENADWKPRLVIDPIHHHIDPRSHDEWVDGLLGAGGSVKSPTIAIAADKGSLWVVGDGGQYAVCGMAECMHDGPAQVLHATALFEDGKPLVGMFSEPITDAEQGKRIKAGQALPAFDRKIDAAAADAEKLFESTLADPKLFAAAVSDRKDVVLFGSAPKEMWTGSKPVKDQLAAWKLAFKIHDGVVAGTTATKTIAYVAANLDARPAGKPDAKPTPYRALFLYENIKGSWQLVHAHFAFANKE